MAANMSLFILISYIWCPYSHKFTAHVILTQGVSNVWLYLRADNSTRAPRTRKGMELYVDLWVLGFRSEERSVCLCVLSPRITFEQLTYFHVISYERHARKDHPHLSTLWFSAINNTNMATMRTSDTEVTKKLCDGNFHFVHRGGCKLEAARSLYYLSFLWWLQPPSSAEFTNVWSSASTPSIRLYVVVRS
jgi:hypothetical protein